MKTKFTLFKLFALIPVLGITFFLAQTQYQFSTGLVYRVKIKGYDPRDLLHGHYLRYTFDLPKNKKYIAAAKYCFTHQTSTDYQLKIIPSNSDLTMCSSVIKYSKLNKSHKYFIPEKSARELEQKLRSGQVTATVDLILHNTRNFTVGQLYFNDQPWEKTLTNK